MTRRVEAPPKMVGNIGEKPILPPDSLGGNRLFLWIIEERMFQKTPGIAFWELAPASCPAWAVYPTIAP